MKDDEGEDEGSVSVAKYPVLPSLVSLQQMRNRLKMAKEGHRLMKWSAVATGQEMRRLAECIYKAMAMFADEVKNCFILLARCRFYYPTIDTMVLEGPGMDACATIAYSSKTSAGVKIQLYNIIESDQDPYPHLGIGKGGIMISEAKKAWRTLLKHLINIMEHRMMFVAFEISHNNATKKSNVLGKIIMPRTELTIAYILSELEEMAREEFFRLKKVLQVKKKLKLLKEGKLGPKAKQKIEPIPPMEVIQEVKPEEKPEVKPEVEPVPDFAKLPCCHKLIHLQQDLDELLKQTQLYKKKGGEGADLEIIQELSRALSEKLNSAAFYHDHTINEKKVASTNDKKGESQSTLYSTLIQTLQNAASYLSIPDFYSCCNEKTTEPANKPILIRRDEEETKATESTSGEKVQKAVSYSDVCQRCKEKEKKAKSSDKFLPGEQSPVPRSDDCTCSQEIKLEPVSNLETCRESQKKLQNDDSKSGKGQQVEEQKSVSNSESSTYCYCSTCSSTKTSNKSSISRKGEENSSLLLSPHKCRHTQQHLQPKTPSHTHRNTVPTLRDLSKASVKYVKTVEKEQSTFSSIVEKIQQAVSYMTIPQSGQTEAATQFSPSTSARNQVKVDPVCCNKSIQSRKLDVEKKSNDLESDIPGISETDKREIIKILRIRNDDGTITEKITIIRVVKEKKPDGTSSDCDSESLNECSKPSSKPHSDERTVGIVSVTFPRNLNYETLERQRQSIHGSRALPMANPLNRHCLSLISLATVDYELQSVCLSLMSAHQLDNEIMSMSNEFKSSAELPQIMNSFESSDITSTSPLVNVSESNLTSSLNAMVHEDSQNDKHKLPKDF